MSKLKIVILVGASLLLGCASTQKAPENLNKYSTNVKATFASYKNITQPHKAFAVAKFNRRDFSGFGYSYPTVEEAKTRALEECQERALKFRDDIKCFIYHSE
jgi:hypothetical protein